MGLSTVQVLAIIGGSIAGLLFFIWAVLNIISAITHAIARGWHNGKV